MGLQQNAGAIFWEGAVVNWQGESNPKPPHRFLETALLEENNATLATSFLSFVPEDKHDLHGELMYGNKSPN